MKWLEVGPSPEWERRLGSVRQQLSLGEQRAADYISQNQSQIRKMTIKQIAGGAGVSQATVVRFCQRLGYDGLKEFKISLVSGRSVEGISAMPMQHNGGPGQVLHDTIRRYIACLQDTAMADNDAVFERAVSLIMKAKKIDLYGVGGSTASTSFARHMLIKVGIRVNECTSLHAQQLSAGTLDKDDAVIVITNKGESGELLYTLSKVRSQGAAVICITARPSSSIAKLSNIVIPVADGMHKDTISAPRIGINVILDAICHSILQRKASKEALRRVNTEENL